MLKQCCFVAAVSVLCLAPSAFASSFSMELTSSGSNLMGNSRQVHVGTYTSTIGAKTGVQVICGQLC